jgi:TrmH family RNA methyltransferase
METRLFIVLVEPQFPFNVGMTARVMGNFGFEKLILVRPQCDPLCKEAVQFSMKGKNILESARRMDRLENLKAQGVFCVGTTRQGGRYRSRRLLPWELDGFLAGKPEAAIVFGNESRGLNTQELRLMDGLATLPSLTGEAGSLNLSMAVGIFLYELTRRPGEEVRAPSGELDRLAERLAERLRSAGIFKEKDYRHGPARLTHLIKSMDASSPDVRFLYKLLSDLEKKR